MGKAITSRMLSQPAISMIRRFQAEGQPCVRGHSVFERVQQETELLLGALFRESKNVKHFALDVILENTDASAAQLRAVQHNIVCFCPYGTGSVSSLSISSSIIIVKG